MALLGRYQATTQYNQRALLLSKSSRLPRVCFSTDTMSSFQVDFELGLSASRLWKALKSSNSLFPKLAPEIVSSIEHVEGIEGESGAVRLIKFGPEGAFMKEKFVSVDNTSMKLVATELEGLHLAAGFTKWQSSMKLLPLDDDNVKVSFVFEYEGPGPLDISEAQAKRRTPKLFKDIEAHIMASGDHA